MKKAILAALALAVLPPMAHAQDASWKPERNVEFVAGVGAGGSMDRTARAIERVARETGLIPTTSTVLNKPGGGQALGLQYVKNHAGDGHYLSINSEPILTNNISGRSDIKYSDFTPIATLFEENVAVSVRKESDIKSLKDVVDRLKSDPASLSVAIGAARGNVNHVTLALLMDLFDGDVQKVRIPVFNSMGESISNLLGGHVDLLVSVVSAVNSHAGSGNVRVLATTAPERYTFGNLTDVPTMKELGYDVEMASMRVIVGPPDMSKAQVAYWEGVMGAVAKSDGWQAELKKNLWSSTYRTSAQTGEYLAKRDATLSKVYARIGLAKKP